MKTRNCISSTVLLSSLLAPLAAQDDLEATNPTAWRVRTAQSVADVQSMSAAGYRPIDIEVESASPLRMTMTYVKNSGSYQKSWTMVVDKSFSELGQAINSTNRMVELCPYDSAGSTRYCAVFVAKTGADDKDWYWWANTSLANLQNRVAFYNARLVDYDTYLINGTRYYSGIAIKNTGSDYRQWSLETNKSYAELGGLIGSKRAYRLERRSSGRYDAVLTRPSQPMLSWWYVGRSMSQLDALTKQNGARITDIDRYEVNGTPYYTATMLQNTNALTTAVGNLIRTGTDGSTGFILKRLDGGTYASLQSTFVFDPASTIKQLHAVYALRRVLTDPAVTMATSISFRDGPCPYTTGTLVTEPLETVVRTMLEQSSNVRTDAIEKFAGGKTVLHAFADNVVGMTDTRSNRIMGCAAPPMNTMTLADIVTLHQWVQDGNLGSLREDFVDRMVNSQSFFPGTGQQYLPTVLAAEAGKAGLTTTEFNAFRARFRVAYKPGGKTIDGKFQRTTSGIAEIPFIINGSVQTQVFVFGAFAHQATDATNAADAVSAAAHELLRDRIAAAMATWPGYTKGAFTLFGTSCDHNGTKPTHVGLGDPEIGGVATYRVVNAPAHKFGALLLGLSNTSWGRTPLPLDLAFLGAPGCAMRVGPITSLGGFTDSFGKLEFHAALNLPPAAIGSSLYTQYAVLAPTANALGVVTTNGLRTLIGTQQ